MQLQELGTKVCNLQDLEQFAKSITDTINKEKIKIIFLDGKIGAGKTTIAKQIISQKSSLKIEDISSPTFSIVNLYNSQKISHFDLYRIKNIQELDEIGFFSIISQNDLCLIEWGEIAKEEIVSYFSKALVLKISTTKKQNYRLFQIFIACN